MRLSARRRARECAVQALYSWQVSSNDITEIEYHFLLEQDVKNVDTNYFHELLTEITANSIYLDTIMYPYLSRQIQEIGQVEKAILRISLYELSSRKDIPYRVVINEGIELAKIFGAKDSYKFVNGVLDKVAPQIRSKK